MKKGFVLLCAVIIILLLSWAPNLLIGAFAGRNPGSEPNAGAAASRDFKIPDSNPAFKRNVTYAWDRPKLVVLDPGHGGDNPGGEGSGMVEKDVTLDVAKRVEKLLGNMDILVTLTREDDSSVDYKDRISSANTQKAALYVSIHCDWYMSSAYNGTSVLYYPDESLHAGSLTEKGFASIMEEELKEKLGTNMRGLFARTDLAVLNSARMPSVLLELGFLSNPKDAEHLASDLFRDLTAESIANGIKRALVEIDGEK